MIKLLPSKCPKIFRSNHLTFQINKFIQIHQQKQVLETNKTLISISKTSIKTDTLNRYNKYHNNLITNNDKILIQNQQEYSKQIRVYLFKVHFIV
jgi:hypothetical protein